MGHLVFPKHLTPSVLTNIQCFFQIGILWEMSEITIVMQAAY